MHDKDRQEALWLLDARVGHFDENIGILAEIDHQLLLFLHLPKAVLCDHMCVMEEEIILRCQLHLHFLNLVLILSSLQKCSNVR